MITFGFDMEEVVGILCVVKKGGRLRLIIDCRKLNYRLRKPARTRLASSAAFAEIEIGVGSNLTYAAHDIQDCFYQFALPRWLLPFLCLPRVRARDAGVTQVCGRKVEPDCRIWRQL